MAFAQTISASAVSAPGRRPLTVPSPRRTSAGAGRRQSLTVVAARNFKTRDTEKAINVETSKTADDLTVKAEELLAKAQARWEKVEEKPAAIGIGVGVLIAIWAASGLVDAIDKLPLVGGLLELVGLVVTGWFAYRYLIFGPDREELKENLDKFLSKVTGGKADVREVIDKIKG